MQRTEPGDETHAQQAREAVESALRGLFLKGLRGDEAAYKAFLQQLSRHLRSFLARRLFGWPDDVEDLVQECLLAMHNQRHTYDSDQPLTAWVHAIARYKMIDLLRAKSGREALQVPLDDAQDLFADDSAQAGDAQRDLQVLLSSLPDRQRLPIVHTKLEGLSVAETAQRMGMSESAVKVNVHRGLKALAARLKGSLPS
ncbi:sigma-70 family RNA polymerase sigma factor [Variovorax dokdonensis]|uniref:Sigma-70 family RNA polymerase sigma factor n=1 Tax=Variovorax dokdonensis TaxID=344883 RepID=A0ABT7NCP2_9BURK|nr:sigma-70 family RNA polymerase sigma factor [Variovorax dokdonensis]MDM0045640.1 sigma-70 family RNA polymerase sigma factor [Variovorax dokdonensis]